MNTVLKMFYPLVLLGLFLALLVGFKHDSTLSDFERNEIRKYLKEAQDVAKAQEQHSYENVKASLEKETKDEDLTIFTYKSTNEIKVHLEVLDERLWFDLRDGVTEERIDVATLAKGEQKEWDLSDYEEIYFHFGDTSVVHLSINDESVDVSDLSAPHRVYITFDSMNPQLLSLKEAAVFQ